MKNKEVKTGRVEQCNLMENNNEDLGEELSKLIEHRNIMFSMLMEGRVPISQYLAFNKQISMAISKKEKEYWVKHGLKFKMETKEIKINVPDGYEVDKENSTFECIKFKPIKSKFSDYDGKYRVNGYYISDCSSSIMPYNVHMTAECYNCKSNKNIFATEKQAKSALAMAQISQIMANDERFGGIVTDEEFKNKNVWIYAINRDMNTIRTYEGTYGIDHFLSFHTPEQRALFLKENRDLVKDYLMID